MTWQLVETPPAEPSQNLLFFPDREMPDRALRTGAAIPYQPDDWVTVRTVHLAAEIAIGYWSGSEWLVSETPDGWPDPAGEPTHWMTMPPHPA